MGRRFAITTILAIALTTHATQAVARPKALNACGTITQSGRYELGKNLAAHGPCIQVNASDVDLDLAGHTITGPGAAGASGGGISAGVDGFAVHDGTVRSFNGHGIVGGNRFRAERVKVIDNVGNGITTANDAIVKDCIATGNTSYGFNISGPSIVSGNVASQNGWGMIVSPQSVVSNNTATNNTKDGILMLGAGFGSRSTIVSNNAANNGMTGITVDCPGHVIGNTALANGTTNLVTNGAGCSSTDNLAP